MTELSKEQAEAMVTALIEKLESHVMPVFEVDHDDCTAAAVEYWYDLRELERFPFINNLMWSMPEQRALFIYAVELASQRVDELIAALPKAEG